MDARTLVKLLWPAPILVLVFLWTLAYRPMGLSLRSWGLVFNFVASCIVAAALFKPMDTIRAMASRGTKLGGYTDRKVERSLLKDRLLGGYGMVLLAMGFVLQLPL